ncbi:MAG: hypothetical protein K9L30_15825 [Desulfobacterales bacterium]|nr:hypothetical protein [Desulfobacterales bacterium]
MKDKFRKKNLENWDALLMEIFPEGIPDHYEWSDNKEIIRILNLIGKDHNSNHTFLPRGGGFDLYGAKLSNENGCIDLQFSSSKKMAHIIMPEKLIFESFGSPNEFSYFRIETLELNPSGVYEKLHAPYEEVVEVKPLEYIERSHWDENILGYDEDGYEIPLPESSRLIIRLLSGALVIFAKGSTYNAVSGTYDGRHNKMTGEDFRQYISSAVDRLREEGKI